MFVTAICISPENFNEIEQERFELSNFL